MSGFFLVRDDASAPTALAEARDQFARSGFGAPTETRLPGWRLLHFPYIVGGPELLLREGDDLVAVAGTLSVDGRMGRPALAALRDMALLPAPDWSRIGGHFAAVVRRGGRTLLLTDFFAAYQVFRDADAQLFSTSLLAAARALPSVRFDAQGVYEFAFNVVPVGDDTVFENIKTVGADTIVELGRDGATLHAVAKPLPVTQDLPFEERIERARAPLEAIVSAHVGTFGSNVHCPLSGGLDSRLVVAALHAAGSQPNLYVYGPKDSEDVRIAQAIGSAEGWPVEWVDKQAAPLAPDAFADAVEANFHENDGLPNYGNIFDNRGNAAARDARHAGGALAASGGCGEIYRDFFYLPNRRFTAKAVAGTFFGRFDRRDTTAEFAPGRFLNAIRDKILTALDHDDRPLPRGRIEEIYPRIRCRALFGREISIESRYGAYLMPFLDHQVVAEAMTLPMELKRAGLFEASLLNAIDPKLASHMSAYGHSFAEPPSKAHRREELSTRLRPAWLRAKTYAIRRRLGPMSDEHGGLLGDEYLGRVIDLEFPAMRRFFEMERVADSGLYRRIACLEYLSGKLGSRLAS